MDGQHRKTYISENALLPAQAYTYFRETEWYIVRGYREEVHMLESADSSMRSDTILDWFEAIGLKASKHEWSVKHGDEVKNGTNVYGILHAPRGDSTEAMVLAAPWFNKDGEYNDGGISLVVSLARYFKKWSVWSKNIIFVITEDSNVALRSWISAYHTSLENTAGAIEGAVVLDCPHKEDYFDSIEIFYEGLNGQLPNLDLINTVALISEHESVKVVIQDMSSNTNDYEGRATTLLRGIMRQVLSGIGLGPGGENFSGWKIDTVTLRAHGTSGPADITTFGRIAESTFRSINNLLEHFHQSFFFYLLLSPKRFVSIGTYLPSAMLVANSFPLMAIYILLTSGKGDTQQTILSPILALVSVSGISLVCAYLSLSLPTSLAVPYIQLFAAMSFLSPIVLNSLQPIFQVRKRSLEYLYAYSMIIHGLFLTALATLNFSLSLVMGLLTIPLAWLRLQSPLINSMPLLIASSPWTGIYLLSLYKGISIHEFLHELLWSWHGLQVWTWFTIVGLWLPVWLIGIYISSVGVKLEVTEEKKNQ